MEGPHFRGIPKSNWKSCAVGGATAVRHPPATCA